MYRRRWPEMPLILGRSETQYVAMVTKLLSLYCGAHLVESYCKDSNISDTNWPRYHHTWSKFGWLYDIITWLICIFKKIEYLWNKEIFENSKQNFTSRTDRLLVYILKWLWLEKCDLGHSTTLRHLNLALSSLKMYWLAMFWRNIGYLDVGVSSYDVLGKFGDHLRSYITIHKAQPLQSWTK